VLAGNVHADLHQLSYESVIAKSYGRYDVNGFCFRSTIFEASCPLAATTNIRVVTRAVDVEGHESKYYEIIKNIIEYNFVRNKNLKTLFFDCYWFDPNHGTRENEFGMVEVKHAYQLRSCDSFVLAHQVKQVYYMSYPCEKLSA
jgi:DeoR/GlpR family transcriptional regulator of sugar metabolism